MSITPPDLSPGPERVARSQTPRRTRRAGGRPPGIRHERPYWDEGLVVAGIDEVGRGAWAGPVSVGIVALNPQRRIHRLRDSKALAPDERTHIAGRIEQHALAAVVGHASNDEIDQIGMTAALRLATSRALADLSVRPDVFLIDGNLDMAAGHATQTELIVKGDTRSASIAAASIVAKVTRDAMMIADDAIHPQFSFVANKGYPSPDHRQALDDHGPCELHRRSWAPIAALLHPRLF